MKPHSAAAIVVAALLFLPVASFAADSSSGPTTDAPSPPPASPGPGVSETPENPFTPGDQLIDLAAGAHIPVFLEPIVGAGVSNLYTGGSFSIEYQYFVARGLSLGGDLAGAVNQTIGSLYVITAPLGFTASYWWSSLPFEFSLMAEAGGYYMNYNNEGMFGPFLKGGGGVYWRSTPAWSLGLQAYFWLVPELHYGEYTRLDQWGGFVETSIAAVYHL